MNPHIFKKCPFNDAYSIYKCLTIAKLEIQILKKNSLVVFTAHLFINNTFSHQEIIKKHHKKVLILK